MTDLPELMSIQAYAGTAAPFNFNGLVRHYYLRSDPQMGDLSVNLKPKGDRSRASHAIALDIRARSRTCRCPRTPRSKSSKFRPVRRCSLRCSPRSTVPTRTPARTAAKVRKAFEAVDFVVDIDDSYGTPSDRLRIAIDQEALEYHGVERAGGLRYDRRLVGGVRSAIRSAAAA